jgi:anti-sigma B factor antagonist
MNENLTEVGGLILDCEGLEYISSAGLRVLLFAQKKMKDSLKLVNVGELIMEVFDITGFSDILTIE